MSIEIKNKLSTKSRYRPEIDGLRAFAVVAVIINHFNKDILPGGYLGVDIFFVISGFVITSSLYQRPSENFRDFISGFYERRIKRLVPALSVFVLITSIAICFFNAVPSTSLKTGLTSLFGLSNLYLFKTSTNYFAGPTQLNVFTHTWSLGVEEQFYILFPFLIWFSGFGRQTKNGAHNLFLIVGTLTITSLIGFLYLYTSNQPAAYFLMPTRFWEMASGCLLFIEFHKRKSIELFLEKIPPLLVLLSIIGVMYLPMSLATVSTVSVVALTLVLIASLKKQTIAFKIFTYPKVVYIGLISYSLYLWHWGVLSISRWTIGIYWWSVPFQVALMFGLAIASYRYIETPIRKSNWFGRQWKTLVVGGGVLVALSGGLIALEKPLKGKLYLGKTIETRNGINETTLNWQNCRDPKADFLTIFRLCSIGSKGKTALLVGDSHAENYFSALKLFLDSGYKKVIGIAFGGQLFPSDTQNDNSKIISEFLATAKPGDTIIFALNYDLYFQENNPPFSITRKKRGDSPKLRDISQWKKMFTILLKDLVKKNINILLIGPSPAFSIDAPLNVEDCSKQWFKPLIPNRCSHKEFRFLSESRVFSIKQLLNEIQMIHPNSVRLIDPFLKFCDKKYCYVYDRSDKYPGTNVFYRDSDHLTNKGGEYIFKDLNLKELFEK